MSSHVPRLVILGNLIIDDLVLADGQTRMGQPGGATMYAALSASLWNIPTGVVSRVGDDYPKEVLGLLRTRRVDLTGVHPMGRKGARTWLLYEAGSDEAPQRHIVSHLERPSHMDVSPVPSEIPVHYLQADVFHVAPMPMEAQGSMMRLLSTSPDALVSLDPCLPLSEDTLPSWKEILPHVDILFLGPDEQKLQVDDEELPRMVREWAGDRLKMLVIKQGERGGVLFNMKTGQPTRWTPAAGPVVDPTGAGDAFAAAFLTALIECRSTEEALQRGAKSAAVAIQGWGPSALMAAHP